MARIVIIGTGECGVRAAFALREQGFDSTVTLIGAETALPYERPPLSKDVCAAAKAIRSEDAYAKEGLDLKRGVAVTSIDREDRKVSLSSGAIIGYDKLLLATGARPRVLPGMEGCLTLRTDADARRIAPRLAKGAQIGIVGGGFIGLELAALARSAGAGVVLFEVAPRILGRAVPEELASFIHARHENEGVRLITEAKIARAGATSVVLADGEVLRFDIVIAGVGSVPNTELAGAAGLDIKNGIVVDAAFRTSDPNIFAAGDCCSFVWRGERVRLESWKAAQDQGAHVAAAMLGQVNGYGKVPWFWSDQYDLTLQVAGIFDQSRTIHGRPAASDRRIVFQCGGDGRICAAAGIGPGNAVATDLRILEKLIERRTIVQPAMLADSSFNLKQLLRTTT